jgi:hypothetical protein
LKAVGPSQHGSDRQRAVHVEFVDVDDEIARDRQAVELLLEARPEKHRIGQPRDCARRSVLRIRRFFELILTST